MSGSQKKYFFTSTAAILTVILAFSICEIVIRIYHKSQNRDRHIWIPDPYLGAVHAPNNKFLYEKESSTEFSVWHRTNALGLMDDEITVRKPKGTLRMVVLGDSFTEALQVPSGDNFCQLLEGYLNSQDNSSNRTYEVINAGVSGYSPITEYLFLKRDLIRLDPNVIIVQLFANDVFEDHKTKAMSVLDKNELPVKISRYFLKKYRAHPPVAFEDAQKISFFEKIRKALINTSRYIEYMYFRTVKANKNSAYNKEMVSLEKFRDEEQFFIIQEESPLFQDRTFRGVTLKNTQKYLSAIKNLAESHHARLVLFYIPLKNQVGILDYGEDVPPEFLRSTNTYFNEQLIQFCQQDGIEFLDLLPVFELNKGEELYYKEDGHLTSKGHRLVAQELFELFTGDK